MRMLTEALAWVDATHMTHRASVFAYAAALVLKLGDRRDLVLRVALRLSGPPSKTFIPNSRRNAGQQMLAMLWYAFKKWRCHILTDIAVPTAIQLLELMKAEKTR